MRTSASDTASFSRLMDALFRSPDRSRIRRGFGRGAGSRGVVAPAPLTRAARESERESGDGDRETAGRASAVTWGAAAATAAAGRQAVLVARVEARRGRGDAALTPCAGRGA